MNNKNLYLDVHVLQTVPSSCINRDGTGSPKTALYGGVTRARVSSQSWKKAIRDGFKYDSEDPNWLKGLRTKISPEVIANKIQNLDSSFKREDAIKKAVQVMKAAGLTKTSNKDNNKKITKWHTAAAILYSKVQIRNLAKYGLEHKKLNKKQLEDIINKDNSLDLALFGRMVAENPILNVDASCQVAHAISTHEVTPEFDFFSAIEEADGNSHKAVMLDSQEYDSATLYRYANINLKELERNLSELKSHLNKKLTIKGTELFLKEFVSSMPNGKANSFANKTMPQYIMITLRDDTPVNLISAFEEPIRSKSGFVKKSIARLEAEYRKSMKLVDKPLFNEVLTIEGSNLKKKTDKTSFAEDRDSLIEDIGNEIKKRITKNEDANA